MHPESPIRKTEGLPTEQAAPPGEKDFPLNETPVERQKDLKERVDEQRPKISSLQATIGKLKAKIVHLFLETPLVPLYFKVKYKDAYIGYAKNIARVDVISKEEDRAASEELLQKIKGNLRNGIGPQDGYIDESITLRAAIIKGVCEGTSLDIVSRHLHGEPIEEIIQKNRKGATKEAAANQAVAMLIQPNEFAAEKIFVNLLEHCKAIAQSENPNELFNVNFQGIGEAFALFVDSRELNLEKYDKLKKEPFSSFVQKFIIKNKKTNFLDKSGSVNVKKLEAALKKEINDYFAKDLLVLSNAELNKTSEPKKGNLSELLKNRDEAMKSVKWLIAMLELNKGFSSNPSDPFSAISDPFLEHFCSYVSYTDLYQSSKEIVRYERGVRAESVEPILGNQLAHKNDEDYLKNFEKLPPGDYGISLRVGDHSAHTITYIKMDSDPGSGYILDPNGRQLRCTSAKRGKELLLQLLSDYKQVGPDLVYIRGKKDKHHMVDVFRFVKIDKNGTN